MATCRNRPQTLVKHGLNGVNFPGETIFSDNTQPQGAAWLL